MNGGTLNLNETHNTTGGIYTYNTSVVNINGTETLTGNDQLIMAWWTSGTSTMNISGTLNLESATAP